MIPISGKYLQRGKLPLLPIFLAGFLAGILIMNMGKSILLENTGLLDEYALYHMKYMTVNSNALFYYVLKQRLGTLIMLAVFATTYLGLAVCVGAVLWYGAAAGAFLSALVIRYGLKGILFALTGVLPQYLLYVPAMLAMLLWCESLCRSIYFRNTAFQEGNHSLPKRLIHLAVITAIVIIGCFLESFVNPHLMSALLKIF
nr:stage II sporulation protein M [uncultured Acetatifactor sp.]